MRKKLMIMLALVGLALGLIGWGATAVFMDSGSVTASISVGTMGITLTSTTPGAIVVNTGNQGTHTVTCPVTAIQSSAPDSAPCSFVVTNNGTMPIPTVHVAVAGPAAPFTDALGAQTDVFLAVGEHHTYAGGIAWPELSNPQLGMSTSVTYTVTATA